MNNFIDFQNQAFTDYFNKQPSQVKGRLNDSTMYHKRYLYNQVFSTLEFNLPENWKLNWFRFWLFHFGSIAVIYTKEFGWICQPYSIKKLDLYYNPKVISVYNSFIKNERTGVIDVNSEIVHLFDDYFGLDDLVTNYAVQLAQIDKSVNINLMNSNVAYLFEAENKKQAEAIKEAYGEATEGTPLVTINKDVLAGKSIETMFPNVRNTFITPELLDAKRTIINEFLTKIGIRNANYDKKERLNSQEVNENNDETKSILSIMYDNIDKSFKKINAISDLQLSVKYVYNYNDNDSYLIGEKDNA